jgi:transcriptional regulator with XRE-family HTH domain
VTQGDERREALEAGGTTVANIQSLDPSASPLDYYGWELRRQREAHGLKQGQLGDIIFCTGSLIGQIETTKKIPTRDFSERVDAALGTDGVFSRLIGLVLRSQLPSWFQPYAEMEAKATYISTYQAQVVYGLLQTEEYARAVLATGMPDDLDGLVAARMERQRILEREQPPLAWAILDEAVLHRPIGGPEVMRGQLARLLEFTGHRWMRVQVLPNVAGEHASLAGSFNLLRFEEDPDVVYTEDVIAGHMTANPETIREAARRYAHLQAAALSVEASAALITRVMEERYGEQPRPDDSTVA